MQIQGGSKHGLFIYTLEEGIRKVDRGSAPEKKKDKEEKNVIYRLTGL